MITTFFTIFFINFFSFSDSKLEESSPDLSLVPSPRGRPSTTGMDSDISSLGDEQDELRRQRVNVDPLKQQRVCSQRVNFDFLNRLRTKNLLSDLNDSQLPEEHISNCFDF